MNIKLLILFFSLLIVADLFSQKETTITQVFSTKEQHIENTLTISDYSLTFSNHYFTVIQTRGEFSYLIYFHNIKSYWVGDSNSFNTEYYDLLYLYAESDTSKQDTEELSLIKRLTKRNEIQFSNDSIIILRNKADYSKIDKIESNEIIANYKCKEYNYYKEGKLYVNLQNTTKLAPKATKDIVHLWYIINILNNTINIETSFNLSFISEDMKHGYPMKTTILDTNDDILKQEIVNSVDKHGISDCECYKYIKYQKLNLVDLLIGAESEKGK